MSCLTKNLALMHQIEALCRACNEKPGDNECESCHRLFCEACTPSHLEQEKREIERQSRVSALKNKGNKLIEKLEMVEEKVISYLSKLRGDIQKKILDAEKNIASIEKVEEVAARADTLLQEVQDFVDKMESVGESGLPIHL